MNHPEDIINDDRTLPELLTTASEQIEQLGEAMRKVKPHNFGTPGAGKPNPSRAERRWVARRELANNKRQYKDSLARTIATQRGTLPDARELAQVHKVRRQILARANAAAAGQPVVDEIHLAQEFLAAAAAAGMTPEDFQGALLDSVTEETAA